MCLGTGEEGAVPIWEDLTDPAIPYQGEPFLGIQPAPQELLSGFPPEWLENNALLVDYVGANDYPSAPSFFEEVRRFGLSRRMQSGFNLGRFSGKQLWLALIHPLAVHRWQDGPSVPARTLRFSEGDTQVEWIQAGQLPDIHYWVCKNNKNADGRTDHYADCLYHLWPLSQRLHKQADRTGILGSPLLEMPSFRFSPWFPALWTDPNKFAAQVALLPQVEYFPGIFAIHPISHLEAIKWVPPEADLGGGPPVVVREE